MELGGVCCPKARAPISCLSQSSVLLGAVFLCCGLGLQFPPQLVSPCARLIPVHAFHLSEHTSMHLRQKRMSNLSSEKKNN